MSAGPSLHFAGAFPDHEFSQPSAAATDARGVDLLDGRLWRFFAKKGGRIARHAWKPTPTGFVLVQVAGRSELREGRCSAAMNAHQMCMGRRVEGPGAMELVLEDGCQHIVLEIPWQRVVAAHPGLGSAALHVVQSEPESVKLIGELCASILAARAALSLEQRSVALNALVSLLGLSRPASVASQNTTMVRALAELERRLHDPAFNPESLAESLRISRRRLDQLFVTASGRPVHACLRERRLTLAAKRLREQNTPRLSVADIAYDFGFESPAHFARLFKRRFDLTPTAYRMCSETFEEPNDEQLT